MNDEACSKRELPPTAQFSEGAFLLVDKPIGWTSFDVVNKLRNRLKACLGVKNIKVGHAGTLDPMATGLLIVCTGKATKQLQDFQLLSKTYSGTLRLGATTPSYDAESPVDEVFPFSHITPQMLEEARQRFLGPVSQVPPIFSAIKVDGQPLYKKARKGEQVHIEPRNIHIYAFDLTRIALPEVDFEVHCSKGTYIRSLAHDFGKALRSGAYLSALRRTAIGEFRIEDAWSLEALTEALEERTHALRIGDIQ
jgi:tRNA pseudouridine55 synthase